MPWKEEPKLPTKTVVEIADGQYTTIPGSAVVLVGPGKIVITRYPTGQVTGIVMQGDTGKLDEAVHRQLQRVGW
jgi:hypothetical protein